MRLRIGMAAAAIAVIAAIATTVAGTATAAKFKSVTCSFNLAEVIPPGRTTIDTSATSGHQFGLVGCSGRFGQGVQADDFSVKATPAPPTVSGGFKDFFDLGTVHGRYHLAISSGASSTLTFTGTSTVTGGTGAFAHVVGAGTLNCTSHDGGVHISCHGTEQLTHVP